MDINEVVSFKAQYNKDKSLMIIRANLSDNSYEIEWSGGVPGGGGSQLFRRVRPGEPLKFRVLGEDGPIIDWTELRKSDYEIIRDARSNPFGFKVGV